MNRWIFCFAIMATSLGGFPLSGQAEEVSVGVPADTKFVVKLDLQAFKRTTIGARVFEVAKKKAAEEFPHKNASDTIPDLQKVHEMLGFDPLQDVGSIVVSGSDYEHPEKSVVVSIQMGKTAGNLEGLILALPGYAAEEYGRHTIHTAAPDQDLRVFGSIHTDSKGLKTILMSTQHETLIHQLDFLDGKPTADSRFKTVKIASEVHSILAVEVFDIPTELIGEGPQSGVAKIVKAVSVRLGESDGYVTFAVALTAPTEKQAEQLRQMAQGLIALASLAESVDPDDQDLKHVLKFVEGMKVSRDGSLAKLAFRVPVDELNKLIDQID